MKTIGLRLNHRTALQQKIDPELNRRWNKKLQKPFALAPADWLEQKLVNKDIFDHQNKHYGNSVTEYMLEELQSMKMEIAAEHLAQGMFTVNGIGSFRDIEGWVPAYNEAGLRGMFNEAATWPAKRAKERLLSMGAAAFNVVHRVELQGERSEIDTGTLILFESAFKQVLNEQRMTAIGLRQGEYLRRSYHIRRRIVEIHPFAPDNTEDLRWGDAISDELKALLPKDFPFDNRGVLWGDTTPYPKWGRNHQTGLLDPISEGLGRHVEVIREKKLRYYHQTYTMMTLVAG